MDDNIERKPEDLAYLAGYIDADGSIGLYHRKKDNYCRPSVSISASRRDILEELREIAALGGNIHLSHSSPFSGRYVSVLKYQNLQACKVCKLVVPYLRLKKVQAQILVHIGDFRNKHRNKLCINRKAYFIPRYEEMKRLNAANKSLNIR